MLEVLYRSISELKTYLLKCLMSSDRHSQKDLNTPPLTPRTLEILEEEAALAARAAAEAAAEANSLLNRDFTPPPHL